MKDPSYRASKKIRGLASIATAIFIALNLLIVQFMPVAALYQSGPALSVTKVADNETISSGTPMGFTITVTNTGTAAATNVKISDSLPGGLLLSWKISPAVTGCSISSRKVLNCTFSSLGSGQSKVVHIVSGNVSNACAVYTNTAKVTASNHPAVSATAAVTVQCADLTVSVVPVVSPIYNNEVAAFDVTVTNVGQGGAKGVRLINTLPMVTNWKADTSLCRKLFISDFYCNLGNLAGGASFTVRFSSMRALSGCGTFQDDAFVSATNESGGETNSASAVVDVHCPELVVTKTADQESVDAESQIGYTMTVENTGLAASNGTILTDTLPVGPGLSWTIETPVAGCSITEGVLNCSFGVLAYGDIRTVHIISPTTLESCGTYSNTVTADNEYQDELTASAEIEVVCPISPETLPETPAETGGDSPS